jgi:hypothetical protein
MNQIYVVVHEETLYAFGRLRANYNPWRVLLTYSNPIQNIDPIKPNSYLNLDVILFLPP